MKKIILIAIIASFALSSYSAPIVKDYIVTDDGISYFTKIKYGVSSYLIAKTEDGRVVKFEKNEILAYRKSGDVFQKKEIHIEGTPCEGCEFLQLMKTKSGFSIYSYQTFDANGNLNKRFFVYKNNTFVLEINNDNLLQMRDFFNI